MYVTHSPSNPGTINGNSIGPGGHGTDICLYQVGQTGLLGVSGHVKIGAGDVGIYDANNAGSGQLQNIYVTGALDPASSIIIEGTAQAAAPGLIIAKAYASYAALTPFDRNAFTYVNALNEDYRVYMNDAMDALVLGDFDLQREIYDAVDGGVVHVPDGYKIDSSTNVENKDGSAKAVALTRLAPGSAAGTILRGDAFDLYLFRVPPGSELTLQDITIYGGGSGRADVQNGLISVDSGALAMESGAALTGNNNPHFVGGGVSLENNSVFTMNGGRIRGNTASAGGGVHILDSTFNMNGGEIGGNTAADTGGDVLLAAGSASLNLSGGAIIGRLANANPADGNIGVTNALSGTISIEGILNAAAGTVVAAGSGYTLTPADRDAFTYLPGDLTISLDPSENKLVLADIYHTVTFKYMDGVSPDTTENVADGQAVPRPADPKRAGYTFTGWFTDRAYTAQYDFSAPVNAPLTLYAGWDAYVPPDVPANSVTVAPETLLLLPGETATLVATVLPENATNKAVTWASSNEAVATVDANGTVTGKSAGTATVTAKTEDGSGLTAICSIAVEPGPTQPNPDLNRVTLQTDSITAGTPFPFTAEGDRQNARGAVPGDGRFVPARWRLGKGAWQAFPAGGPYAANATADTTGSHLLTVEFALERWNGSAWLPDGAIDTKSVTITVSAAQSSSSQSESSSHPQSDSARTQSASGSANPQTGDSPSLPAWGPLTAVSVLALAALVRARMRRRTRGRAGQNTQTDPTTR